MGEGVRRGMGMGISCWKRGYEGVMEEGVWETGYGNQWGVSLGVKLYLVRDVWVDFKSFVVLCNGASRNKNAAPYKQVRLLWMFYRHLELGMPKAKFSYFSLCYFGWQCQIIQARHHSWLCYLIQDSVTYISPHLMDYCALLVCMQLT